MQASSRDEIKELLRKDVYASSGVWDVENVSLSRGLNRIPIPMSHGTCHMHPHVMLCLLLGGDVRR